MVHDNPYFSTLRPLTVVEVPARPTVNSFLANVPPLVVQRAAELLEDDYLDRVEDVVPDHVGQDGQRAQRGYARPLVGRADVEALEEGGDERDALGLDGLLAGRVVDPGHLLKGLDDVGLEVRVGQFEGLEEEGEKLKEEERSRGQPVDDRVVQRS